MPEDALVNTDAPVQQLRLVGRVREIQIKLHKWAADDGNRRFCDLFNLVADPAFLAAAWTRVRGNRGAKTAVLTPKRRTTSSRSTGCHGFWRIFAKI